MQEISNQRLTGERALFQTNDANINNCIFEDGESPLKECNNLELADCTFGWKYPIWYSNKVTLTDCTWKEMARAGVWYSHCIAVEHAVIEAPKNFRRCGQLVLMDVNFTNAEETLWQCDHVTLEHVKAKGDYFAMNSHQMTVSDLELDGNYSFDGCKDIVVRDSRLICKDAFWNCENVTVYDSYIEGEYLGWNSKNLTFVNCTIESLQGMCYISDLKMVNCKFKNTTLAFEYSTVEAEIDGGIESVFNPSAGTIQADEIGELILETDKINTGLVNIVCKKVGKRSSRPEWLKEDSDEI